ncbi:MAG: homoserine O-acetyltransferase, partial [bacterium]|nr:homoserine O-acetyltransferase [Candidatus Kapabacteria bacterium]
MSDRQQGTFVITSRNSPFALDSGSALSHVEIAYETYGTLNEARDNAILVCHALTGSAHVSGVDAEGNHGWWDALVGPGRAIDTRRYFVICTNILGGCYGSTGPTSIDPSTGVAYGDSFSTVTIRDMVRAQRAVIAELGIERLHTVIGGSMGGMQVLEWAAMYPDVVERIIPIATCAAHSPWCIGLNAIAREALELGRAAGDEAAGLRLARKVAMISYRSDVEFNDRFGRDRLHDDVDPVDGTFDVERYLERHGEKLVE